MTGWRDFLRGIRFRRRSKVRVVRVDTGDGSAMVKTSAVVAGGGIEYWTVAREADGELHSVLSSATLPEAIGRHEALVRELME
jgi:hypothetical protein